MSNALLLPCFSLYTVQGPPQVAEAGLLTRLSGQQEVLGLEVRDSGLCVPAQDPLVTAPSEETAFSSGTWCHQRTGLLLLVSGMVDLHGPGPHIAGRWHSPVSPGDKPCWPQPGFGPLSAHTASLLWTGLAFPSHRPLGKERLGVVFRKGRRFACLGERLRG